MSKKATKQDIRAAIKEIQDYWGMSLPQCTIDENLDITKEELRKAVDDTKERLNLLAKECFKNKE